MSKNKPDKPKPQPIQPLYETKEGVVRFQPNALVQWLLDNGGKDLNDLCDVECSVDDRRQFAQLIGYSLGGYSELSYVDDQAVAVVEKMYNKKVDQRDAVIAEQRRIIDMLKTRLREPIAELFGVHPSYLDGDG